MIEYVHACLMNLTSYDLFERELYVDFLFFNFHTHRHLVIDRVSCPKMENKIRAFLPISFSIFIIC